MRVRPTSVNLLHTCMQCVAIFRRLHAGQPLLKTGDTLVKLTHRIGLVLLKCRAQLPAARILTPGRFRQCRNQQHIYNKTPQILHEGPSCRFPDGVIRSRWSKRAG